jgi:hypothetical protein
MTNKLQIKNLINKNLVKFLLIFLSLLIIMFIYVNNSKNIANKELSCGIGNLPTENASTNLPDNKDYIFDADPGYEPRFLFDADNNRVIVNSFIECVHYFDGGWNYLPEIEKSKKFIFFIKDIKALYLVYILLFLIIELFIYKNFKVFLENKHNFLLITNFIFYVVIMYSSKDKFVINIAFVLLIVSSFKILEVFSVFKSYKNMIMAYFLISTLLLSFEAAFTNVQLVFFPTGDNFADTLKLIMGFDFVRENNNIINIFDYRENNPYMSKPGNIPFYYHLTPLYLLIVTIFGYILKIIENGYILLLGFVFLTVFILYKDFKKNKLNKTFTCFAIFCYPTLFMFQRGNFVSFIIFICLHKLIIRYFINNKLKPLDLLFCAFVINLRPNYILIFAIFFFVSYKKYSFKNILNILLVTASLFYIALKINQIFHKNYTFENFIKSLNYYTNNLVFSGGDSFNSSAYAFLKEIFSYFETDSPLFFNNFEYSDLFINNLVLLIIFFITIFNIYNFSISGKLSIIDLTFRLMISSLLISPKIGDYHLMILITILFIYLIPKYDSTLDIKIFPYLILFILLPKPHHIYLFSTEILTSLVFNSVTLIYILNTKTNINLNDFKENFHKIQNV